MSLFILTQKTNETKISRMNIKHLNNYSQSIFGDGEIGRMRRQTKIGGKDTREIERRQLKMQWRV